MDPTDLIDAKVTSDPSILSAAQKCGPGEDCSAFAQNLQRNRGIKVPRTAIQQYMASQRIGQADLQPGDHVFFDNNQRDTYNTAGKHAPGGYVNHVGVYLGNGNFIADPGQSSDTRTPQDLNAYLRKTGFKFMGGGRFGGTPSSADPTDAIDAKFGAGPTGDPTDAIDAKFTSPPGGALWNQLGQAQQSQTVNGPVDKALQWLQGPKDRPIAGPPLMPGGPGTAADAGSQAGNVVNDVMHPSMAWAYPQSQPVKPQQPTNNIPALQPAPALPWTHDAILKTAQNASQKDMETLFKQLPRSIFDQIDMARQGMHPQPTGIDTSGTGLPGAAQANALANAPGTRPVGEKSASTGPNGAGWDLALKGVGKTIVGLGDPGGSFANVSGDPDEFYRTIGRAYLSAVPQAAALAATGGTSSLASVALTPAAFQLFGGVPSDPEGVLESIASIGALHGVHLSLGALKNVLPGLLSKAGDAPAFQAALDKLNLTKPQRTLVEEAAQHFGVDPSAVTMGENGGKPTVRIPGERSREVSGTIPVEEKSPYISGPTGEPKTFYHYSEDPASIASSGFSDPAKGMTPGFVYLSEHPGYSSGYENGGTVMGIKAKSAKMFDPRNPQDLKFFNDYAESIGHGGAERPFEPTEVDHEKIEHTPGFMDYAVKNGYDAFQMYDRGWRGEIAIKADNVELPKTPPVDKPPVSTDGIPPDNSGHGISQEMHDTRAARGEISPIEPGTGMSPEAQIKEGRAAIASGTDPIKTMDAVEAGTLHHAEIPKALAILRAHAEDLAVATRDAIASGDTNAIDAARATENDWLQRMKPIATSASETFRGLQGQVDLDTGKWTELAHRKSSSDVLDRPLTDQETNAAKSLADRVKTQDDRIADLSKQLTDAITDRSPAKAGGSKLPSDPEGLRAHFAKRIDDQSLFSSARPGGKQSGAVNLGGGPVFTPAEIRAIWDHAKTHYIDPVATNGQVLNIGDVADGTAHDLGLHPDWVKDVIAGRKTEAKAITDNMYRAMAERRKAVRQAQDWANSQPPTFGKHVADLWRLTRQAPGALAVAGHGTVSMFSHAGADLFGDTARWGSHFLKQFKLAYSTPFHEEMMQSMARHPQYNEALRNGLKIDRAYREDYGFFSKAIGKVTGKLSKIDAAKGMDILKPLRLEKYAQDMANAPAWAKADPDLGKMVAQLVNRSTGAGNIDWMGPTIAKAARETMFAPSLEAARWSNMIGDTAKTVKTYANFKNASPAELYVANLRMRRAGRIMAFYTTALVTNQALLKTFGSNENVNFTDPSRADWLKFKAGAEPIDLVGGRTGPLSESFNMLHALYNDVTGQTNAYKKGVFDQLQTLGRNKLAPQYQILADLGTRQVVGGRPVPWSKEAGKGDFSRMSWPEYFSSKLPIPVADASKAYFEGLTQGGVDKDTAGKMILRLVIAGTGVREGYPNKKMGANEDPVAKKINQATDFIRGR